MLGLVAKFKNSYPLVDEVFIKNDAEDHGREPVDESVKAVEQI